MADPPRPTDPPESNLPPAAPDDLLDESQPFEPAQRAMHGLLTILFEQADQDSAQRAASILDRVARERAAVAAATDQAAGPGAGAPSFAQRRVGDGRRQWGGRRPPRPVYAAAGLLAAAACIALLVIPWSGPAPTFDAEVGAFGIWAYQPSSVLRGEGDEAAGGRSGQQTRHSPPAWIEPVLAEPGVRKALNVHETKDGMILFELGEGRLRLDAEGRLVLANGVDQASPCGRRLLGWIEDDRAACETIVEALVRHVPGAKPEDRPRLAEALNRYRAEHVFGEG